ncbi:hypothetical protein [Methylobacterium sp. Leaf85]|uniref:Uncharacterized protein n=1 Tax=Methylobacterium bullatum TaxID=570505 RepID=A0A679K7D0_9HYPH|nr:hypothetical protein [Methylobacterium sp. Leaf85]KQO53425.1 hypothetical protein ASF08_17580 [Methylobacterium sp. Leaf85]MBD8903323.1 hypothetical protein [Methylobacterium bullatum]GJD41190.1 hypothetical protein OICFNHDK_3669 [Methylobacterium bullatum]CAA2144347.1 hypothetical protein MBLL_03470 [Methylobacterium bullatum]
MTWDRHTNRAYAAAVAVGGLVVLMIQEAPNWNATLIGIASLVAFGILWILPEHRTVDRRPSTDRGDDALWKVAIPREAGPAPHELLLGPPGPLGLIEPRRRPTILAHRRLPKPRS